MRKRYKVWLIIIIVLIVFVLGIGIFKFFFNKEEDIQVNTTSVVSSIEEYGYTLDDRDTEIMVSVFNELESILSESEIDNEAYANTLAKLFIIDFYTLSNKINKYDVGGLEYIYSDKTAEFKEKAMDTIYSDIIDNTYKDRVQELPEITSVEIKSTELTTFTLNEEEVSAYKITLEYTYKEDLGYDKEGTIYLVSNGIKLEIVKYDPVIENS